MNADVDTVVSYRNSTSHHTSQYQRNIFEPLYLIEILHQTTTYMAVRIIMASLYLIEILHQTTTAGQAVSSEK